MDLGNQRLVGVHCTWLGAMSHRPYRLRPLRLQCFDWLHTAPPLNYSRHSDLCQLQQRASLNPH